MATQLLVEAGIVLLSAPPASIGTKLLPSLAASPGCRVTAAFETFAAAKNWIVSVVGEKVPATGPAPATIVAPLGRFVFHCSLAWYSWPFFTGITAWTKAAFGDATPAKPPLSFHAS